MTATLLIAVIGLTDIMRSGRGSRARWLLVASLWAVIAVIGVLALALPPLAVAGVILIALAWMLLMPSDDAAEPRRLWPVPVLLIAVIAAAALLEDTSGRSPLASAWNDLAGAAASGIPLSVALAAAAVAVFLTTSGNIIVRAALGRSHAQTGAGSSTARRIWELRIRGRAIGEVGQRSVSRMSEPSLKGGRLIGPIERVLIVVLAISGTSVLIAALVAAKGVVRFPEISEDRGVGSKAEEFLVGSFASWSLSAVGAGYLAAVIYL